MADKPQNPPVDPDAPTEQSVKQALDALPTWEEWLAQKELQRHGEVINAFREHGVKMRRLMRADRPYYALFWIPTAVEDVSYDLYLEPDGTGWSVSAEGHKRFDDERWGEFDEDFEIDRTWTIPAGATGTELAGEVDNILSDIHSYKGPEEPTIPEPDYDDIDESLDAEIGDYEAYAKASAGWNPVQMLTSKQIRQIVREAGFKVSTIYRSRTDHGWSVTMTPATAQALEVFQQNPHRMAEFMEHTAREAIKKLMPSMAKIKRGRYNLDDRLYIHAWEWSGSADPSNPNNWVIYLDIRPADYQKYRRGGIKEAAVVRNFPVTESLVEAKQYLHNEMRRVQEEVNKESDATWTESLPVPDSDDPQTMLARMRAAKMGDTVEVKCPACGDVKLLGKNWPDDFKGWGTTCGKCQAFIPLGGEIVMDSVPLPPEDDVDPAEYTADTLQPERILLEMGYHGALRAEDFTGIKFIIYPDGSTKRVEMPADSYNLPPHRVTESEDVDNPEQYIQTTFDPRQFLEQHGWQTYKREAYEYWHKDYPLPHSYYLGGMRFNIIRLVVGFDPRFRGAYSCVVQTFWAARPEAGEDWIDMTKASMPGNNWHLLQQRVYPEQEDETDDFTDANMPLRRFVMGIDRVMAGIAWPDSDNALVANVELERALARFIHELNDMAEAPIHDRHPMRKAQHIVDVLLDHCGHCPEDEPDVQRYLDGSERVARRAQEAEAVGHERGQGVAGIAGGSLPEDFERGG